MVLLGYPLGDTTFSFPLATVSARRGLFTVALGCHDEANLFSPMHSVFLANKLSLNGFLPASDQHCSDYSIECFEVHCGRD
jgi:hypothetical protein